MARNPTSTQTVSVYTKLKADILSCRLPPGARLWIKDIAAAEDVSLGAVREALAWLAAEDMAVATAQKGYSVPGVSIAELRDLTETRVEIESLCLRNSIAHADLDLETRIVAAFHRLDNLPERDPADEKILFADWLVAHAAFHDAIVGACASAWLLKLRHQLYEQSERYRRLSVPLARQKRNVNAEHRAIYDAVMKRDAERGTQLMADHIRKTTEILVTADIFKNTAGA